MATGVETTPVGTASAGDYDYDQHGHGYSRARFAWSSAARREGVAPVGQ
jgi:hypothetical protein